MDVRRAPDVTYPPAPWTLRGWGIATVGTIDVRAARRHVPPQCSIVTVAPGRTLGGLLFVSYESGSTLVYRELSIVAALVRAGRRMAFAIPRLYVDSEASRAGGRAIWAVPKELASFEVTTSERRLMIVVRRGDADVCRIDAPRVRGGVRLTMPAPAFGQRPDALLFFTGWLRGRFGVARARVTMPLGDEFAGLSLAHPAGAVFIDDFVLTVPPPTEVR